MENGIRLLIAGVIGYSSIVFAGLPLCMLVSRTGASGWWMFPSLLVPIVLVGGIGWRLAPKLWDWLGRDA